MISVIIPVANESETVSSLVAAAAAHPEVDEVIVVDDGSIDDTRELARRAGARVMTSTFMGKGVSLQDGMKAARNKILVFLDPHLKHLPESVITRLVVPIREGRADLTKSGTGTCASDVSALTARPLLRIFFPELSCIEYPLTGLWAARKSLLEKLTFEPGNSVEVGVLLDAVAAGARVEQVCTGPLDVKREDFDVLEETARSVTQAILHRAAQQNRLKASYLNKLQEKGREFPPDLVRIFKQAEPTPERIALFDIDGVLVHGSFILELAHHTGKGAELGEYLDNPDLEGDALAEKIADLFAGIPRETFEQVAHDITLMPGARETVAALRKGYLVGVVTDAYHIAAEIIRCRLFADFSVAHLMKFSKGKATGQIQFAPAMSPTADSDSPEHSRANIMGYLQEKLGIPPERVLAVGNSEEDVGMLKAAGQSVAFRPNRSAVRAAAQVVVEGALPDLVVELENQSEAEVG